MMPVPLLYSIRREDRYKRETKYSLHSMGNIFLDLRRRDWWVLTPSPHTHKYYYAHYSLPRTSMYLPLSHVHVHISAHHIYTLWTLWCTFAPYTLLLFLSLFYKFTMCMYNVVHPVFTRFARFSHHGRKSSQHRVAALVCSAAPSCGVKASENVTRLTSIGLSAGLCIFDSLKRTFELQTICLFSKSQSLCPNAPSDPYPRKMHFRDRDSSFWRLSFGTRANA